MKVECHLEPVLDVLVGKWKHLILIQLLNNGTMRFNALKRAIPGITQKMLTSQLRELEFSDIIARKVYAQIPPKVDYSFTEYGLSLVPVLSKMHEWGALHVEHLQERTRENQVNK